jgi:hypothetical protein
MGQLAPFWANLTPFSNQGGIIHMIAHGELAPAPIAHGRGAIQAPRSIFYTDHHE